MERNKPTHHPVSPKPDNFESFVNQKTALNRRAVLDALKTLASTRCYDIEKSGATLNEEILDEAMEELVDVLNRHGIGACQPGMRQKLLSDPQEPCWKYDPRSVMRCTCYAESCPVAQWHADQNRPVPVLPLDGEDMEFAYPDGIPASDNI